MRFFHLSDLHIGKQLHHYSLKEDQEHILGEIIEYAGKLHPDAVVIAGDIYDKPVPSAEAVTLFDDFLTRLAKIRPQIPVMIISGNHDSADRLRYAAGILKEEKIYRQEAVVPDRGLPFKLFRFEGADGKYICEAHQHSCVEIFALREGKVDFYLGDKKYVLPAGKFIIVNSNEVHSKSNISAEQTIHWTGTLHICLNLCNGLQLVICFNIWESCFKVGLFPTIRIKGKSLTFFPFCIEFRQFLRKESHMI